MTNRKATLDIHLGDVPMLAAALRTASCVAMMEGHHAAKERLDGYRARLEALIPEPARVFDGNTWAEICEALESAPGSAVQFERWGWGSGDKGPKGRLHVVVGDRRWSSRSTDNHRDDGTIAAVVACLEEFSPVDVGCTRLEDTEAGHLRPAPPLTAAELEARSRSMSIPRRDYGDDFDDDGGYGYNP